LTCCHSNQNILLQTETTKKLTYGQIKIDKQAGRQETKRKNRHYAGAGQEILKGWRAKNDPKANEKGEHKSKHFQ